MNSAEQTLPKLVSIQTVVFLEDLSRVVGVLPDVRRNRLEVTPTIRRSDEENGPASPRAIFPCTPAAETFPASRPGKQRSSVHRDTTLIHG